MKKILFIDDDHDITESVRLALEANRYEVTVCYDGDQGLATANKERPDLIILDMMMPKRSGFLVLETLRQTNPDPIPIIMITANDGERHKVYAESLGIDGYIYKPFPIDVLLENIERALNKVISNT